MRTRSESHSWRPASATDVVGVEVGAVARITGGENRGYRGTVTHVYGAGVMAGLVVLDDNRVAEAVDVRVVR